MRKNRKKFLIRSGALGLLLLACLAAAVGCGGNAGENQGGEELGYTVISQDEAYQRMLSGAMVLDVRTPEEYAEKHIPGAVLLPNEEIGGEQPELLGDKEAEILIYCRSGNRSKEAAQKLVDLGYTNVFEFGGINDWANKTVNGEEAGTLQAPDFTYFTAKDIDGNPVDEGLWAGHKLTMVNVWATFCSPCMKEMPWLGELSREYAAAGTEVQIVGIVSDIIKQDLSLDTKVMSTAEEIIGKTNADYLHLVPSLDLLYAGIASIESVPTTFFLDAEGNLVGKVYAGSREKDAWKKIIEETLAEVQ